MILFFSPDLRLFFLLERINVGDTSVLRLCINFTNERPGINRFVRCHPMIHWDMRCGGDDGELLIYAYDHNFYYS